MSERRQGLEETLALVRWVRDLEATLARRIGPGTVLGDVLRLRSRRRPDRERARAVERLADLWARTWWKPHGAALRAALRERARLAREAAALPAMPPPVHPKRDALAAALALVVARDREAWSAKVGDRMQRIIPAQLPAAIYQVWLRKVAIAQAEADLLPVEGATPHAVERVEDSAALAAVFDMEARDELRCLLDGRTPSERQYAELRYDNPEGSYAEIGALMTPRRSAGAVRILAFRLARKIPRPPM